MGAFALKRLFSQGKDTCVEESKEMLRKRNEAAKIVEGKELKREKNNVGGRGGGTIVSVLRTLFSAGPTPTALK